MSSYLIDGPCPNLKCLTPTKYEINHLADGTRVLEATCSACGAYKAYDGATNIVKLSEIPEAS